MGFWLTSGIYALVELVVLGSIVTTGKRGHNALKVLLGTLVVVCSWLLWAVVYVAQIHPHVTPQLQAGKG